MKELAEGYYRPQEGYFKTCFEQHTVRPYPDNPPMLTFPHTYLKSEVKPRCLITGEEAA
jgi:hypothetical protein